MDLARTLVKERKKEKKGNLGFNLEVVKNKSQLGQTTRANSFFPLCKRGNRLVSFPTMAHDRPGLRRVKGGNHFLMISRSSPYRSLSTLALNTHTHTHIHIFNSTAFVRWGADRINAFSRIVPPPRSLRNLGRRP